MWAQAHQNTSLSFVFEIKIKNPVSSVLFSSQERLKEKKRGKHNYIINFLIFKLCVIACPYFQPSYFCNSTGCTPWCSFIVSCVIFNLVLRVLLFFPKSFYFRKALFCFLCDCVTQHVFRQNIFAPLFSNCSVLYFSTESKESLSDIWNTHRHTYLCICY